MEIIGKLLLFGGFIVVILTQLYIIFLSFRISFSAGLFCLLVTPVYALVSDLRKDDKVRPALKVWFSCLALCLLGATLLMTR
jgi:hypothetical protein